MIKRSKHQRSDSLGRRTLVLFAFATLLLIPNSSSASIIVSSGGPTSTPLDGEVYFAPSTGLVSTTYFDAAEFALANFSGEALAFGTLDGTELAVGPDAQQPSLLSVARLGPGASIGPSSQFDNVNVELATAGETLGNWNGFGSGFIGLSLAESDGIHYGWADITVHPDLTVTLSNFAYNTTPDQLIITPMVTATPEPSSSILLALGFASFLFYRGTQRGRQSAKPLLAFASGVLLLTGSSLRAQNPPAPSINPTSIRAGSADFTLTVTGAGFSQSAVVNWNGTPLATKFVNNQQLTAQVPASDISTVGTITITVTLNNQTSYPATFQIAPNPPPYPPVQTVGVTDPMGKPSRYTLFRSDALLATVPTSDKGSAADTMYTYKNTGKSPPNQFGFPSSTQVPFIDQVFSAAGHIIPPSSADTKTVGYPEDVVYAHRQGSAVQVDFANPDHAAAGGVQLPGLADRLDASDYIVSKDFIAIAVGDLDRAPDDSGEPHDEVAVAYASPNDQGTWYINLAVLNYNGGNAPPKITSARTPAGACGPACFASVSSFKQNGSNQFENKILPAGNSISVAIGDFDGDGFNEIAVAHFGDSVTTRVSIFRYRNDNGALSLTPVTDMSDQLPSNGIASNAGSLSMVAGDFNGDGKDELALAKVIWWKQSQIQPDSRENLTGMAWDPDHWDDYPAAWDYRGYAIHFALRLKILQSGMTFTSGVTLAPSSPAGFTAFTFQNASQLVPNQVTFNGGTGNWAVLNGSWQTTIIDQNTFAIRLDSSKLGSLSGQNIAISTITPVPEGPETEVQIRADNPGGWNLDNIADFKDGPSRPNIQLASGLFHYDPAKGFPLTRRQFVAIWNSPMPSPSWVPSEQPDDDPVPYWPYDLVIHYFEVSTDGQNTLSMPTPIRAWPESPIVMRDRNTYAHPHQRFSITAGNFVGNNDTSQTTWQVAAGAWLDNNQYHLRSALIDNTQNASVWDLYIPTIDSGPYAYAQMPALAYDAYGEDVYLGAPIHLQLPVVQSTQYIIEEPPKLLVWRGIPTINNGVPGIQNIFANDGHYVVLQDQQNRSLSTTTTTTEGDSFGISNSRTAKASISVGDPEIEGTKLSASDTSKIGFDRSYHHEHDDIGASSYTITNTARTDHDDYIESEVQNFDIWRYRVYGIATGNSDAPYAFRDFTFPGNSTNNHAGGTSVEWYQPVHENRNLLSYPAVPSTGLPDDVGSPYTINGQTINTGIPGVLSSGNNHCVSGAGQTYSLEMTGVSASNDVVGYDHTLSEDNELNLGIEGTTALFPGISGSYEANFSLNLGGKQSWGNSTTHNNSSSGSTSLTYQVDTTPSTFSYQSYPVTYLSSAGTLKMKQYVAIPTTGVPISDCNAGANFFTDNFALPDPALNLPFRWNFVSYQLPSDTTTWELVRTVGRKQIRGFFVQKTEPNQIESAGGQLVYDNLAVNPSTGSKVRLAVRVYNFSVVTQADQIKVQFSIMPWDDQYDNELGCGAPKPNGQETGRVCPPSTRMPVGGTPIDSIPAWNTDASHPNWTTAAYEWLIPPSLTPGKYRVYVNLLYNGQEANPPERPCTAGPCPLMAIDQTDPNWDPNAPGQNNEGYGYITIAAPAMDLNSATDIYANPDSLQAQVAGRLRSGLVIAYAHQPLTLRAAAAASGDNTFHHRVTVFDGDPSLGAVVAGRIMRGVDQRGTYSWFQWTPSILGLHTLTMQVAEGANDFKRNNNTAQLKVLVIRAPGDLNEDGSVDRADLDLLERNLGMTAAQSVCGTSCDLNGDGQITRADLDLAIASCSRPACAPRGGIDATKGAAIHLKKSLSGNSSPNPQKTRDLEGSGFRKLSEQERQALHSQINGLTLPQQLWIRSLEHAALEKSKLAEAK